MQEWAEASPKGTCSTCGLPMQLEMFSLPPARRLHITWNYYRTPKVSKLFLHQGDSVLEILVPVG